VLATHVGSSSNHNGRQEALTFTGRTKIYAWKSLDAKKASMKNLLLHHTQLREEAFNNHQRTALDMKGRFHSTLTLEERDRVQKARFYLTTKKWKARKKGDFEAAENMERLVDMLPSHSLLKHPPPADLLTPELEHKMKKAQLDKEYRETRMANSFLKEQFGIEKSIPRGRKRKDLSEMDPDRAKRVEKKRLRYAEKKQKALKGSTGQI
jgi:hypothetical protein